MSLDPDKPFHDGDAPTIDKAIAGSVIADYVSGKLQTLACGSLSNGGTEPVRVFV